jgi:UDP-N-acetylmuramate dehydrogenase
MNRLIEYLRQEKIEYYRDGDIRPYTTIQIGGRVGLIAVVRQEKHLRELLTRINEGDYPFVLLGGGSNVIFADQAPGLLVIINRTAEIGPQERGLIRVNSGVTIARLMTWCSQNQMGGLEFLAGIPGTIGGAAAVNAGAFGQSVADVLEGAEIWNKDAEATEVKKEYFQFAYRRSVFKTGKGCILNAFLRCTPTDSAQIKRRVAANLAYRKENHPDYSLLTAGCFFKNPLIDNHKVSAGQLIEEAGLKGVAEERLATAQRHANFVINRGGASFGDIDRFAQTIIDRVFYRQGVRLEREVIYISPEGRKY